MFRKLMVVSLIALFVLVAIPALAQQSQVDVYEGRQLVKSVVFVVGRAEYFVNGETPGVKMDVVPYIDQGRTFVPVRYLGYALGVAENNVRWDGKQRKASLTLPPNTVEMVIGKKQVITNGQAKQIDVAPQLKDPGRTFLPARYVAEGLGYQIGYKEVNGVEYVYAWPKGQPEPVVDVNKVKEFLEKDGIGSRFPPNAVRVYSVKELGVEPVDVPDFQKTAVYKATATVNDLPLPLDGFMIYDLKVDRNNWNKYDTGAITVTMSDEITDLLIVAKGGNVRYRQADTVRPTPDGKVKLTFWAQHLGEKLDGKPLLRLEDVEYFVVDTTGEILEPEAGLLFIENPYKS